MEEAFKTRLRELGVSEGAIQTLEEQELNTEEDLEGFTYEQLVAAGVKAGSAKKLADVFGPKPAPVSEPSPESAPAIASTAAPSDEVIPEGKQPSAAQVHNFAQQMGIDPTMLMTLMFTNVGAQAGIEMDLSSFLPIDQIIGSYNPKIRNMPYLVMGQVEQRLNTPIVVINADGSVNPEQTVKYVMSLEEGFEPAADNIWYDEVGAPYEVIRVGVDAQSVYDADPLYPSRALQKNGMGLGRVNWNGVALDVRQVVFYAVTQTHEISPSDDARIAWLRDRIKPGVTRMALRGEFPNALARYNEAARTGSLPTLRVQLSRTPRRPEMMPRRRAVSPRDLSENSGREVEPVPGTFRPER